MCTKTFKKSFLECEKMVSRKISSGTSSPRMFHVYIINEKKLSLSANERKKHEDDRTELYKH